MGTDGTFDSSQFKVPGAYISSFSLDIHDVPGCEAVRHAFEKRYGQDDLVRRSVVPGSAGDAMGISNACNDGKMSRDEVRKEIGKVKMSTPSSEPDRVRQERGRRGRRRLLDLQDRNDGSYGIVQKG